MTPTDNSPSPGTDAASAAATREEAQRRLEELLARRAEGDTKDDSSRRRRAVLVIVLVLLLLLLCGVGAFLYRLLAPGAGGGGATDGGADSAGITWVRSIYGFGPAANQLFANPNDAATGPDGTIWVSDPANSRVVGFRGDGTFVRLIQGDKVTGEPFRLPSRLAVDPDGLIYIVDRANEALTIMDGDTKLVGTNIPGITAIDTDEEIVVLGSQAGFAITDKDGNVLTLVGTKGSGEDQFDSVGGVAIDSETQTIYVVDTYNNRLSAWDYSGAQKWIVLMGNPANNVQLQGGGSLETSSSAEAGLQLPTDVTVDGKGRPVVLDAFDFSLSAFSPTNGGFVGKWGAYGDRDGQFMYPSGFDYDITKDWFTVADTQNLRAQVIRIPGSGAEGAAGVRSWLSRLMAGPARALWPCCVLLPLLLLLLLLGRWRKRRKERDLENRVRQQALQAGVVGSGLDTSE
jgi:hypothetical protein